MELPGAADDQLNPPSVTPDPAPADDRLVTMAVAGAAVGAIVTLIIVRWLRRNITVSRRVL